MRQRQELVLLLAGEVGRRLVALLGQQPHRLRGGLVVQRVVGHRVDERRITILEALTRLMQRVRGVGHRLHATGHHNVVLAGADQLVGHRDGVGPRETQLVDRDLGDAHRDAGRDGRGARGVLTGTGMDDLAEVSGRSAYEHQ